MNKVIIIIITYFCLKIRLSFLYFWIIGNISTFSPVSGSDTPSHSDRLEEKLRKKSS